MSIRAQHFPIHREVASEFNGPIHFGRATGEPVEHGLTMVRKLGIFQSIEDFCDRAYTVK